MRLVLSNKPSLTGGGGGGDVEGDPTPAHSLSFSFMHIIVLISCKWSCSMDGGVRASGVATGCM